MPRKRTRVGAPPQHPARGLPPETAGLLRRASAALDSAGEGERGLVAAEVLAEAQHRCLGVVNSLVGSRALEQAIPAAPAPAFAAFCSALAPHLASAAESPNGSHVVEAVLARALAAQGSEGALVAAFQRLAEGGLGRLLASRHASFVLRRALGFPALAALLEPPLLASLRAWPGEGLAAAALDPVASTLLASPRILQALAAHELFLIVNSALPRFLDIFISLGEAEHFSKVASLPE